ncbi:MAG: hypothetical protein IH787_07580 [Nitrospirae bacterium]|nr:hypothetical protein [Nitrospirota bacterium]
MLRDIEFFTAKLGKLDGFGDAGDHLAGIVKAKEVKTELRVEAPKDDAVADTSMYVGRWFVMLPISKKHKIYLLPEFQPIYDFENNHFSFWVGPEIGKMINKKNIIYVKPGWGVSPDNLAGDRSFTFEIGWRYFMD